MQRDCCVVLLPTTAHALTSVLAPRCAVTFSLSEAFRRRERALRALSQLRAALQSVLQGTRDWDWPPVGGHAAGAAGSRMVGGRNALPPTFVEVTRRELLALVDMQAAFLLRPINNRTRHRRGGAGAPSDAFSVEAVRALDDGIRGSFDRLSRAVEVMKAAGLPGNEASRLRQFTAAALADWELLRALKMYRTPLSIRAFSRIYTLLHPFFMGAGRRAATARLAVHDRCIRAQGHIMRTWQEQ